MMITSMNKHATEFDNNASHNGGTGKSISYNVYRISVTSHIHRNLDTTRQDVQKAAVAAFRIAGFW